MMKTKKKMTPSDPAPGKLRPEKKNERAADKTSPSPTRAEKRQTKNSGKPEKRRSILFDGDKIASFLSPAKRSEPVKKGVPEFARQDAVKAKKTPSGRSAVKETPKEQEKSAAVPSGKSKKTSAKAAAGQHPSKSADPEKVTAPVHQRKGVRAAQKKPTAAKNASLPVKEEPRFPTADGKLRIIPLGGIGEIGKNMTAIEYENDIVVIDVGVAFPDEDMLGIDLVIPDVSYLVKNASRVRGILITHGHEDHVGAVAYVLRQLNVPVYGTPLSLGIIKGKLKENPPPQKPDLRTVNAGDTVRLGALSAEFIHVNHSIADACAIAVHTPLGVVYHSGDFKLDVSPMDGNVMDLVRVGELGREGVILLLCESTNAERRGFTPSERSVGSSLERIFTQYEDNRLVIATFSSNVHRVQQIINTSIRHGRKVAVMGRSMVNIIDAAVELGYMDLPDGVLIDVADMKRYKPEQITMITTGSQGEPMSALYRIAFSENEKVKLGANDVVVLSSSAIPGNEKLIGNIINALVHTGVKVVNDSVEAVHVSGHACREELKLLMALTKPKYLMPVHGEYRHLAANKEIGEFMGIPSANIFLSEIGRVLEIDKNGARFAGTVPAGKVLVDGASVGDIGAVVLRDRKNLSEDGVVAVVAAVALREGMILSGPDIVSRGFVYVKEAEKLMENTRKTAQEALARMLERRVSDYAEIKAELRDVVAKFIYRETKRNPMILPIIMDA